jgi:hypothetical protein
MGNAVSSHTALSELPTRDALGSPDTPSRGSHDRVLTFSGTTGLLFGVVNAVANCSRFGCGSTGIVHCCSTFRVQATTDGSEDLPHFRCR